MHEKRIMNEFLLRGLDGANPLAYLAALGTLRTATGTWPASIVQMHWVHAEGGWRPSIGLNTEITQDRWLASLHESLHSADLQNLPFSSADDLTIAIDMFRNEALKVQQSTRPLDERYCDFLAAFGSEAIEAEQNGKKTGQISDTAFRTMGGAGHQHFLGSMRNFFKDTEEEHLRKALFFPWRYDDAIKNHTMRWDPRDDIRYALRWNDPSGDPERQKSGSVWGANRLAIEGLSLFPTAPVAGRLETTGFTQKKREDVLWTWPIWTCPLGLDVVKSLLALRGLQEKHPDRTLLQTMGVEEIFRCQRITVNKVRNFTPAFPA